MPAAPPPSPGHNATVHRGNPGGVPSTPRQTPARLTVPAEGTPAPRACAKNCPTRLSKPSNPSGRPAAPPLFHTTRPPEQPLIGLSRSPCKPPWTFAPPRRCCNPQPQIVGFRSKGFDRRVPSATANMASFGGWEAMAAGLEEAAVSPRRSQYFNHPAARCV